MFILIWQNVWKMITCILNIPNLLSMQFQYKMEILTSMDRIYNKFSVSSFGTFAQYKCLIFTSHFWAELANVKWG